MSGTIHCDFPGCGTEAWPQFAALWYRSDQLPKSNHYPRRPGTFCERHSWARRYAPALGDDFLSAIEAAMARHSYDELQAIRHLVMTHPEVAP